MGKPRTSDRDRLLAAIQQIHAAGLDEELWPQALKAVTELIGGVGASLEVMRKPHAEVTAMYAYGLPGSDAAQYVEHYAPTCKRTLYGARQKTGAIIYESQFTDDEQIRADPFYMEFLAHCDMRYFIGAAVRNDARENVYVAVQRALRQDHVARREIALYRTLLPHVQQAYDVMRRLSGAQARAQSLADALDWIEDGVLTLGEGGQILHANAAAEAILRRSDGVQSRSGALDFTSAEARTAYMHALRTLEDANSDPAGDGPLDFVAARRGAAPPYLVSLRPLPDKGPRQATALLFLRDPLRPSQVSMRLLAGAFDLTAAEARLAAALIGGVSPGDYARRHGLSANTAYVHLRNIKAKCGESRMAALIHRLHAAAAPARDAGPGADAHS